MHFLSFPSRCAAHPSSSLPPPKLQAWCRRYLLSIMFLKTALTFLVVGVFSVNALTVPVPRSPAPEPEGEFTRSLSTISYHGLTFVPSTAQQLEARLFWDRDLELLPRAPLKEPPRTYKEQLLDKSWQNWRQGIEEANERHRAQNKAKSK